ncbi:MAG: GAF domain-containing protein [Acholeplasmataceae bacterium]
MKKDEMLQLAKNLLYKQPNMASFLANAAAFLNEVLDDINWVGFYLYDGKNLTVGPFQGKVACALIELGAGVCGTAALKQETIVVKDVHAFDGHIACDANSQSEVVVPIIVNGMLFGVLDVDSPTIDRFDLKTVSFLEAFVALMISLI